MKPLLLIQPRIIADYRGFFKKLFVKTFTLTKS